MNNLDKLISHKLESKNYYVADATLTFKVENYPEIKLVFKLDSQDSTILDIKWIGESSEIDNVLDFICRSFVGLSIAEMSQQPLDSIKTNLIVNNLSESLFDSIISVIFKSEVVDLRESVPQE